MSVSVEPRKRLYVEAKTAIIYCVTCEGPFWASARQARAIRLGDHSGRCGECRRLENTPIRVTTELRRYWTSRFTHDELVELAEGMWGRRDTWPRDSAFAPNDL